MPKSTTPRRRVNVLATLGAELFRLDINYDDRDALRTLLSMRFDHFLDAAPAVHDYHHMSLGVVIADLIKRDALALGELGTAVLHQRRADAYHADCASWEAQPEEVKLGSWRQRPPKRGQRMLILRIAEALGMALPGEMTRGEAHDWIKAHGGNPRYSRQA